MSDNLKTGFVYLSPAGKKIDFFSPQNIVLQQNHTKCNLITFKTIENCSYYNQKLYMHTVVNNSIELTVNA